MRLWSLHPKYPDPRGLVALWREGLLAQKVLLGKTNGYTNHPQLLRFSQQPDPAGSIAAYLNEIVEESKRRHYHFDATKIMTLCTCQKIKVTQGQRDFEWRHLLEKLKRRSPAWFQQSDNIDTPEVHPLFFVVPGPVQKWERGALSPENVP